MKLLLAWKKSVWILSRVLTALLVVALMEGDSISAPDSATLRIAGTGGALGSMRELAAAFQKKHPGITVKIISHVGTRGGITGVLKGALDIGLAGRRLYPQELSQGLREIEYSQSPFVFVTGRGNRRLDLSYDLIAGIYRGEVTKWPDGTPIRPILRPEGDVDILMLKEISPAIRGAVTRAASREGMTIATDDQHNCDLLEKIPGSFGTSTLTQILAEKRSLIMLPLNGVPPTVNNMVTGRYPHFKAFHMVTGPKSSPLAGTFIEFVQSPQGGEILTRAGNHLPRSR